MTQDLYKAHLAASASLHSLSSASRIDAQGRPLLPEARSLSRTRIQGTERKPTDQVSPQTMDMASLALAPVNKFNSEVVDQVNELEMRKQGRSAGH